MDDLKELGGFDNKKAPQKPKDVKKSAAAAYDDLIFDAMPS